MKLIGLLGCLTGNKTKTALKFTLNYIKEINSNIEIEFIDLKDYDIEFCSGKKFEEYNDDTKIAINKILSADKIIIATPIYQAGIPGVLKNLLDFIPRDGLQNKTTGIIATGGTYKHLLVPEYQLKPILSFLKASVLEQYVFAEDGDFENGILKNEEIIGRIHNLVEKIINNN